MTGSPGTQTCGSCHGGGSGTTTGAIELRKKDWGPSSTPVSYYEAGKTYIVTLRGTNASLSHFGFQLITLDGSNTHKGVYSALPANVKTSSAGLATVVEHNTAIAKDGSGNYVVSFEWTAPASASGPLNMYGIINGVNNDNNSSGDAVSSTITLMLADRTSVTDVANNISFKVYPNPVQDMLNIYVENTAIGVYDVVAYNASGAVMTNETINVSTGSNKSSINTAAWPSGLYFVQISKDGNRQIVTVVK